MSRKKTGIPHERAHMAVLIQQMLIPELSFIMHTVNPINHNPDEIYVELVVGLGETLASSEAPGIPYRMVCNKHTGAVQMLAYASFSHAAWPDPVRNLFEESCRKLIIDFAKGYNDQIFGLVIHDQVEVATRFNDYVTILHEMETRLTEIIGSPYLFIEYAVGLEPELFISLFKEIHDLEHVSGCVDIGHIGLWQARTIYSHNHPGSDICAFKPNDPDLPGVVEDVQSAVRSALDTVLHVIQELCNLGKPLYFHLHDAHPLSTFSPFGVSDHLSFLVEIPIPFEYTGKKSLHPMFGPSGLLRIVTESLQMLSPDRISFSLEIHPTDGRLPLGNASYLFNHWADKENAERMNYWLSVLLRNHQLVLEACKKNLPPYKINKNKPWR